MHQRCEVPSMICRNHYFSEMEYRATGGLVAVCKFVRIPNYYLW